MPTPKKNIKPFIKLNEYEKALVKEAYGYFTKYATINFNLRYKAGFPEVEDAVNELIIIFCERLQGKNPFNPNKSKLYTYCVMLGRSVFINRFNRACRRKTYSSAEVTNSTLEVNPILFDSDNVTNVCSDFYIELSKQLVDNYAELDEESFELVIKKRSG